MNEVETLKPVAIESGVARRDPLTSVSGGKPAPAVSARAKTAGQLQLAGQALTGLGILVSAFLVFEFLVTSLTHDRAQAELLTAFKQQVPTTTLDATTAAPPEGSPVALLHIPRLNLDQVVVEGTSPEDLKSGPGHLRAGPLPGEFGNAVIAGRRTTYGGPFRNLDLLRVGDPIRITTGQGVFYYTVSLVKRVDAGHADPLTATLDTRITLVTSDPAYFPAGRLVVVARIAPLVAATDLSGTPLDVEHRAPLSATISDLGLAGDPLGLVLAIIFAQLLLGVLWLVSRLARRWPLSLTIMFATPTVLALTVLAFSNVDRLLPGML